MNQQKTSKKPYIILAVIVILAACVYFYFQGSGTPAVGGLLEASGDTPDVSAEVTALFSQIRSLQIDTTLFKDPSYLTLRDYTVPIPVLNVGRVNPFAPLSGILNYTSGSSTH
jgi:hypothetical protein